MTTTQEDSLELLKEYAVWEYAKINGACEDATKKISKWMFEFAENSEKDQNPEDMLWKI